MNDLQNDIYLLRDFFSISNAYDLRMRQLRFASAELKCT